ncbi:MAG: tRNA (adenosine(37)-N6)-threonylcarbamoyltransferase complex dimerization subunit type 1 TsaB [Oscillospiraceae bacterium]|nr:tRNA (adenosine(37)-N6)-threonylcarbamoyltransferase complex dimerization subunit type 1 TsaB [Oscillospiraceae bacterium]
MLILAFESSAKPASVAVFEQTMCTDSTRLPFGKLIGQYFQNNGFSHSKTLLSMAESLLNNLELKPNDIDLVAVANGPGSFTGVRIGVSAAKGFASGLDIPICGVSTLEAMARQTRFDDIIICPVMDARRDQVYNALFAWRNTELIRLCDDRAISIEDLYKDLNHYSQPPMLVGDGVSVCRNHQGFADFRTTPTLIQYQTAYGVALAAMHAKPVPATELEPFYLRPSQAERERSARG